MTIVKRINERLFHLDHDQDNGFCLNDAIIDIQTGERYVITAPWISDFSDPDMDIQVPGAVLSQEQGFYDSYEEADFEAQRSGWRTLLYNVPGGQWTYRTVRLGSLEWYDEKDPSEICYEIDPLTGGVCEYLDIVPDVYLRYTIRRDRGQVAQVTGTNLADHGVLYLLNVATGEYAEAHWDGQNPQDMVLDPPPVRRLADKIIDFDWAAHSGAIANTEKLQSVGTTRYRSYEFASPLSAEYLDSERGRGTLLQALKELTRDPVAHFVYAGPLLGPFATEIEAQAAVCYGSVGTAMWFPIPRTDMWGVMQFVRRDSTGKLKPLSYPILEEDVQIFEKSLDVTRIAHCHGYKAPTIERAVLAEDPRLAELEAMVGQRVFEAFKEIYDKAHDKKGLLDSVFNADLEPQFIIHDLIAQATTTKEVHPYPPYRASNGLVVYFLDMANLTITHSYIPYTFTYFFHHDSIYGFYLEDNMEDLRKNGFTVKVITNASSADLLRAVYSPQTAGLFIYGHSTSPVGIESSHQLGVDIRDIQQRRISHNLRAFYVAGCEFLEPPESCASGKYFGMLCSEDRSPVYDLFRFVPQPVSINGYDGYHISVLDGFYDVLITIPDMIDYIITSVHNQRTILTNTLETPVVQINAHYETIH